LEEEDAKGFLFRLAEVCERSGWKVHAYVLMSNHFHLLLETPEPNLVDGMRYLMGTFSQGWNARHQRRGHVFQGRYKSIPVSGERAADGSYFRVTADYIHLNTARARLLRGESLTSYAWSSLSYYEKGNGPKWLHFERVLEAFHLDGKHRGRKAHKESDAEELIIKMGDALEYAVHQEALALARKGVWQKALLASMVEKHCQVRNEWIAKRLKMSHLLCMSMAERFFRESEQGGKTDCIL